MEILVRVRSKGMGTCARSGAETTDQRGVGFQPAILQNQIKILLEEKFGGKLRECFFEIHISEIQGKNRRLEAHAT